MAELNLAFHDIGPRPSGDRFTVEPALFDEQIAATAGAQAHVRATFDDGFRSAAEIAAPVLARHGLRGVVFVITSQIGRKRYLDGEHIRDLHAAGHTIGSHTHSHPRNPFLRDLPRDEIVREWRTSKAILEDVLQAAVVSASVPYGFYAPHVGEAAAAAGYEDLYTSRPTLEPREEGGIRVHGRFGVLSNTRPEHIAALCSLDARALGREISAYHARNATRRLLGPLYFKFRRELLARRHA